MEKEIYESLFKRGVIKRNQNYENAIIKNLFNNNEIKFGHFLIDLHEKLDIKKLNFSLLSPFSSFETINDVEEYLKKETKQIA